MSRIEFSDDANESCALCCQRYRAMPDAIFDGIEVLIRLVLAET